MSHFQQSEQSASQINTATFLCGQEMDLTTIEKLSARLNLRAKASTQPPKTAVRRRLREMKPLGFVTQYQEMIQKEKQHLNANKYAQELAAHAAHRRHATYTASPPQSRRAQSSTVVDQSILTLKQHLSALTRSPAKRTIKVRKTHRASTLCYDLFPLERTLTHTANRWNSDLPELTATRYGEMRAEAKSVSRVFTNQIIKDAGDKPRNYKTIDTQTPEPLSTDVYRTGLSPSRPMRPLPVYRLHYPTHVRALSAQEHYSDLEQKTC